MIVHIISGAQPGPQPGPQQALQAQQAQRSDERLFSAQPASQIPSSAAASMVVLAVPDAGRGRNAELQSALNQQPKGGGTSGINEDALKVLEDVLSNTSSDDEFRAELRTQLAAAGHDPSKPIMDIRV
ncbi:hypothetical protein K3725_08055 [Leisingera sp. S132]|uniref:hypothetical protein n=1 Tax=Leisingera sp. S132 TaxID=2867016 RepID=UPI0021A922EC|nr:hypothetical protein [Leisingera sp. S132]UWQ80934.1 hypothetical protein K3725_08055 [Leisingera sp. S132]